MGYIYKPSKGALYGVKDAQRLGEFLESAGFSVSPERLVELARPPASPIHDFFEWDDTAAAEAHRRWQARNHINHLQIIIKTDGKPLDTRAYHSVVISNDGQAGRGYCHMINVAENEDLREQVIAKALAELNGWRARYQQYRDVFNGVFRVIEETARKVKRRQRRKKRAKVRV